MAVIPEIECVTWMDIYRDGGSLSISFTGIVGEEYCLLFEVAKDRDFMTIGYNLPKLTAYYAHEWKSKFTGEIHSESTKETIFILWEDSIYMLDRMKHMIDKIELDLFDEPLTEDRKEEYRSMYETMCRIANSKGLAW
jgi:hypothetical protein